MTNHDESIRANKAVVLRFNQDVIHRGDAGAFAELMALDFVNRTAPPGMSPGADGMWSFFQLLRAALPDLDVVIHQQIGEGDLVTTRKTLRGTHQGELLGIAPTGRTVAIEVIDIVRVAGGRYAEHWGINTFPVLLASLRADK